MSELMDFISKFAIDSGKLPLIHTTDKYTLQLIRQSKQLETSDDKVYPGEKLLYMFYGRPSFRVNPNIKQTSASFFAPVCLIFDRNLISSACRIMPFDSGAHAAGMLEGTIHKRMEKVNFELDVNPEAPMKLIKCFYGNELAYLENNPQSKEILISDIQRDQKHHVEAYYHLVHHRSNSNTDERVNAIEIQFDKEIPIQGNLQAIIVPSRYFGSELVKQMDEEFSATVIMYEMPYTYSPTDLMNTIYEKVLSFVGGGD